jgi:hypothetical protein
MLSVIILSVVMLSVIMLSVIMLSVIMMNAVMLRVVMQSGTLYRVLVSCCLRSQALLIFLTLHKRFASDYRGEGERQKRLIFSK